MEVAEVPTPSSGFTTRVDGAHLADLMQIYCQKPCRTAFRLVSEQQEGVLFFETGQVFHAQFGQANGLDAIVRMLLLKAGSFEPSDRAWPSEGNLQLPADVALLQAAKRIDEQGLSVGVAEPTARPTTRVPRHSQTIPRPKASQRPPPVHAESKLSTAPRNPPAEVHLSRTGAVLSFRGEGADALAEAVAFSTRLGSLAGEALGLSTLLSFQLIDDRQRALVAYRAEGDTLVGVLGEAVHVGALQRRLGLK